jgi:hypothetical protein
MRKIFPLIVLIIFLVPNVLGAQLSVDKLPQQTQDLINSTPGLADKINELYNKEVDVNSLKEVTGVTEKISFSLSPSSPRPGQLVTATLSNYSSDLNKLQISWYVNDILVKKEIGATKHSFTVGDLGKLTKIKVVILKQNGTTFEKTYSFRPAEVALIYEAQTFTPPFYDGKAYFSRESKLKVYAIPQVLDASGKYVRPENIIYKWYLDGSVVQDQSGYGKQTFDYKGGVLSKSFRVGVDISTMEDNSVANSTISINPVSPEVLIYEKSPTLGALYNNAISSSFSINTPEIEFEAVPYFFDKDLVSNRSTVYGWKLNGSKINSPNINSLIFRNEKNEEGRATIGVDISNSTMLQRASNSFSLIFGETKNEFRF